MNFEDELNEKLRSAPQEREISLGTGTILGIFFVLALICGGFSGFGYTMGHKSAQASAGIPDTAAPKTDPGFGNFKAAPLAASTPAPTRSHSPETTVPPSSEAAADTTPAPADSAAISTPGAPATVAEPPVATDGAWMVQVSATTRKPDAEALAKVLVGQGFTATIKQDADLKFHVRVGPFAAKKDADTTRKLLVDSGYKDPFLTPR